MLVKITNKSPFNVFIDVDGDKRTEDTVQIGPKGREVVELPSEKRYLEIAREFGNKIVMRKV